MLAAVVGSAHATLLDGVIALWPFDEGEGAFIRDVSGNENHGELTMGFKWDTGKFGPAPALNVGRMIMPDSETMGAVSGLTIMAWVYHNPDGGFDSPAICGKGLPGADNYALYVSKVTSSLVFTAQSDAGGINQATEPDVFTLDAWHHVVLTYGADGSKFYVDGDVVHEGDGGANLTPNADDLRVGHALSKNGPYWWYGWLDEVGLDSRPLSAGEIALFAAGGISGALAVEARGKLASSWAAVKSGSYRLQTR